MYDVETKSQDTTELCDVYLERSELCGVCCVLWCVGFQIQGLGSNACHKCPPGIVPLGTVLFFEVNLHKRIYITVAK
jgi:hypothetical protein